MKKNMQVKGALVPLEAAFAACDTRQRSCPKCGETHTEERIMATRLAIGLAHNRKAVKAELETIREALQPTEAINRYNEAMTEYRQRNATRDEAEIQQGLAKIREEHSAAIRDMEDLRAADREAGNQVVSLDIYRIPASCVPGWYDSSTDDRDEVEDKNGARGIPFSALCVFVEHGIIYDPEVEDCDGNPVIRDGDGDPLSMSGRRPELVKAGKSTGR